MKRKTPEDRIAEALHVLQEARHIEERSPNADNTHCRESCEAHLDYLLDNYKVNATT